MSEETTYLYMRRDIHGIHAAFLIAQYQKYALKTIKDIAQRLEAGQSAEDIEAYYFADGCEFTEDIWYMAQYMVVLDVNRQN